MFKDQFVSEKPTVSGGGFTVGKAFGVLLIIAGLCVLGWVLGTVVELFNNPSELARFVETLPSDFL